MRPKKPTSIPKRSAVGILILFFALTLVSRSQERDNVQLTDTSKSLQSILPRSFFVELPFLHPQSLGSLFRSPAGPSQLNFWTIQDKIDLLSPWKLELANQEEYRTWQTILKSIELGGVAYIGYEHIKKYGLK
jgi:hypothetical protein